MTPESFTKKYAAKSESGLIDFATRREVLHMSLGAATFVGSAACRAQNVEPAATDDAATIEKRVRSGQIIPRRATAYQLDRSIVLASNSRLMFEQGVEILYTGTDLGDVKNPIGIFVVSGNAVQIIGAKGVTVRSQTPSRFLYAVLGRGIENLTVTDISTIDCNHVYVTHRLPPSAKLSFADIITSGPKANISRNIAVIRGGARFREPMAVEGHGSCFIGYTFGWKVVGAQYFNVSHAVQWWGGNANHARDGMLSTERKCGNGQIVGVKFQNVVGGCWGAMGRNIQVTDCEGSRASDVLFDTEGGQNITFLRCTGRYAKNGCFAMFFFNRGTRFIDCRGYQPAGSPIFRVFNSALTTDNRDVSITGGHFEGIDGIATFDTARGPIRSISVSNAVFRNVRIDFGANNNHRIEIINNRFSFDRPANAAFNAIQTAGTNRDKNDQALVVVTGNRIQSSAAQPAGSIGILVQQADYNGSPSATITRNQIAGFSTDIVCRWKGRNRGTKAKFTVAGNVTARGRIIVDDTDAAARANVFISKNAVRN